MCYERKDSFHFLASEHTHKQTQRHVADLIESRPITVPSLAGTIIIFSNYG